MTSFRLPQWAGLAVACAMAALVGPSTEALAQGSSDRVYMLHSDTPGVPDLDLRTVRPFHLKAAGDGASMGFRLTGNFGPKMDNYSPCSNTLFSCQNVAVRRSSTNGFTGLWFSLEWAYGVPPSQWRKIRAVAPSVANATGGGWSAGSNDMVLGR